MRIRPEDKKIYVLNDALDLVILEKIYDVEKCDLSAADRQIVNLIRTQLKREWRKPLVKFLDKLIVKYDVARNSR